MNQQTFPAFPLWWLDESKRNITGLGEIAAHLHQKTEGSIDRGSGFRGAVNDMEKQLIEYVTVLEQRVGILTDVTQCLLGVVAEDYEYRHTRFERMLKRIGKGFDALWCKDRAQSGL